MSSRRIWSSDCKNKYAIFRRNKYAFWRKILFYFIFWGKRKVLLKYNKFKWEFFYNLYTLLSKTLWKILCTYTYFWKFIFNTIHSARPFKILRQYLMQCNSLRRLKLQAPNSLYFCHYIRASIAVVT